MYTYSICIHIPYWTSRPYFSESRSWTTFISSWRYSPGYCIGLDGSRWCDLLYHCIFWKKKSWVPSHRCYSWCSWSIVETPPQLSTITTIVVSFPCWAPSHPSAAVPFVSFCKAKDGDVGIDTRHNRHHNLQTFCAEQSSQSFVNQDPRH